MKLSPAQIDRRLAQILAADSAQTGASGGTARLMLMLTRSCELRCSYCFVDLTEEGYGIEHSGQDDGSRRGDMSLATAEKAIDLWMTSKKERLGLQLFGGEPSRSWATLCRVLDYARQHPLREGRELELQLTSNGLGLQAERLEALLEREVTLQLSVDGDVQQNRFRRPFLIDTSEAWRRWERLFLDLRRVGLRWFLNSTLVPAAAAEGPARYRAARALGAPGLQLNYATGIRWSEAQIQSYLEGLLATLRADHTDPGPMQLYNWQNAADPAPLCGDTIVDVDGSILQVGGIFHEKRFPALRAAYLHGHLSQQKHFGESRVSLAALWARTRSALSAEEAELFLQGMRMGAAQDLLCRLLARELGRG